tara:strand:+ start:554 stop:841 length:288 start_codon:yes stop_codon:yes gene_type:complete
MKTKTEKQFGNSKSFGKDVLFPKHLTPKIIHSALFIHNAPTKEDIIKRTEHCVKEIGDEAMSFAMALLVLPHLMDNMANSNEYKDWKQSRIKTLN